MGNISDTCVSSKTLYVFGEENVLPVGSSVQAIWSKASISYRYEFLKCIICYRQNEISQPVDYFYFRMNLQYFSDSVFTCITTNLVF